MTRRLLVIGLDGVGFDLIAPWVEAGELPFLGRLLAQGTKGPLLSTIPPLTGPAWTSFLTGVNPGKHGVFGWTKRRPGSYAVSVINGGDIGYPTILELASESGRQVVSIGLPVTYPARPVNGVVVPGMLTPRGDRAPTYPPQVYSELRRAAPDYRFFPECAHRVSLRAKVQELLVCARGKAAAARHFMQHRNWDMFLVHFQVTDKVQHDLWGVTKHGIDPLLIVFQEVDRLVGQLVEIGRQMGATVIVLSDHGMGPQEYTFSINTWLWQAGYLQPKGGVAGNLKRRLFRLGLTQRRLLRLGLFLYPIAYRMGLASSFMDIIGEAWLARMISSLFLSLNDIDWAKTRVYSRADIGHLCLNLKGREPHGIVDGAEADRLIEELIDRLKGVKNPYTDEPLLGDVFRREAVYHGERLAQAPDILFLPQDLRTIATGASGFYSKAVFDRPQLRANHRMNGIVIGFGKPFRTDHTIQQARLVDLPANLLYLLGCPIPTYMDGRIWEEAFLSGTLLLRSPQWSEHSSTRKTIAPSGEKDDLELVRRLKGLGYLS